MRFVTQKTFVGQAAENIVAYSADTCQVETTDLASLQFEGRLDGGMMHPSTCTRCPLHVDGTPVTSVRGTAYQPGGVVLMYDMPSPREFEQGDFQLDVLQDVLEEAQLSVDTVALLAWVKCRPPRGRLDDTPFAVVEGEAWREPELADLLPGTLVLMGRHVVQAYFGATATVGAMRGKPLPPGRHGTYPVVATWHPWATRQDQRLRKDFVNDLTLATELSRHAR